MAKKKSRRTSALSKQAKSTSDQPSSAKAETSGTSRIFDKFQDLYENPAVRSMAASMVNTAFTKLADGFMRRYPSITNLLRNSFDSIEEKLSEFKEGDSQDKTTSEKDLNLQH